MAAAACRPEGVVQHYLIKSEPHEFSIDDLEAAQGADQHTPVHGTRPLMVQCLMRCVMVISEASQTDNQQLNSLQTGTLCSL